MGAGAMKSARPAWKMCRRGVPFHIEDQDTYSIVKKLVPEGKTMCSLCSRLRRGILYRVADEVKITKIVELETVGSTRFILPLATNETLTSPVADMICCPVGTCRSTRMSRWMRTPSMLGVPLPYTSS